MIILLKINKIASEIEKKKKKKNEKKKNENLDKKFTKSEPG